MESVKNGDSVLLIWSDSNENEIEKFFIDMQKITNVPVVLENSAMITEGLYTVLSNNFIILSS